jgi:Dolichyl-phosphate-mannose-protein mannosyltransferase
MSTATATPAAPRVDVRRLAVTHAERLAIGGAALWCLALVALTWNTWGDLGRDTGYDLLAASRTADGELPYVDYVYYYGPAAPLLLGLVFALAGAGSTAGAGLGVALGLTVVALTFRLARFVAGPWTAAAAAALSATAVFGTGNNSFVQPHTFNAPLAIALSLGALVGLGAFLRSGHRRNLLLAGVLAGLAGLARPETAAALMAGLGVWAIVHALTAADRRTAAADGARLLVPALAIPAAVYGAFAVLVGPRELVTENLYPIDQLRAGGSHIVRQQAPLTASSVVELAGHVFLYGLLAAGLVAASTVLVRRDAARRSAVVALAVIAATGLLVLAIRPETVRHYLGWAYAWIPAGALIAAAVLIARRRSPSSSPHVATGLLIALTVMLGVAALRAYGSFSPQPRPDAPQATAYLLPLVAIVMAWLHGTELPRGRARAAALGTAWILALALAGAWLVARDASSETATVRGAHGVMQAPPEVAGAYQDALQALELRTEPGEPVLLAPQLSALYVLSGRTDPLPQLSLLPGALATPADEERAIARLADVRVVITDRRPLRIYGRGAFGDDFNRRIGAWLRAEFRRVATFRGSGLGAPVLDLWQRSAT